MLRKELFDTNFLRGVIEDINNHHPKALEALETFLSDPSPLSCPYLTLTGSLSDEELDIYAEKLGADIFCPLLCEKLFPQILRPEAEYFLGNISRRYGCPCRYAKTHWDLTEEDISKTITLLKDEIEEMNL
jgi:hypothetical protein